MTQISSNGTFYVKIILPIAVFIGTPLIIYKSLSDNFSIDEKLMTWLFSIALLFLAFYSLRLKYVFWDSDYLIVRSWNKEIKIEKWEISKINDNYFGRPNYVTIFLKWDTDFGKVIRFIPKGGFIRFFWTNKIVKDLNAWINL